MNEDILDVMFGWRTLLSANKSSNPKPQDRND
jgi:hypothetical protein